MTGGGLRVGGVRLSDILGVRFQYSSFISLSLSRFSLSLSLVLALSARVCRCVFLSLLETLLRLNTGCSSTDASRRCSASWSGPTQKGTPVVAGVATPHQALPHRSRKRWRGWERVVAEAQGMYNFCGETVLHRAWGVPALPQSG